MTDETRSWAPHEAPGPKMKTKPIATRHPTLTAVAKGVNELHACHEDTREKIKLIMLALGIPWNATEANARRLTPKIKPHVDWKTIAAIIGATSGGLVFFKIIAAVAPAAWQALLSVN